MARYSGKSLGAFGELGGVLEFDWEPDPEVLVSELLEASGYLQNIAGPLAISREILKDDVRMRFRTKVDPEGTPWQEWSDSYAKYREKYYPNGGILVRTKELRDTATADEAFVVGEQAVFINTSGMPPYWLWTQTGATRTNPNTPEPMTKEEVTRAAKALGVSEQTIREVQAGGNELPARPFIGASFEAEIKIFETFDAWFDGALQLAVGSKGKVFGRHAARGPGGQFVKRV